MRDCRHIGSGTQSDLERVREDLARDVEQGDQPADSDPVVVHLMTASLYLGYGLYRDRMSKEAGIPLEELDRRATKVAEQMFRGIVNGESAEESVPQG